MPLMLRLDLDGLTFGDLYRFADLARGAGLDEDHLVGVETADEDGQDVEGRALVAVVGDTDGPVRPVMVDGRDARASRSRLPGSWSRSATPVTGNRSGDCLQPYAVSHKTGRADPLPNDGPPPVLQHHLRVAVGLVVDGAVGSDGRRVRHRDRGGGVMV